MTCNLVMLNLYMIISKHSTEVNVESKGESDADPSNFQAGSSLCRFCQQMPFYKSFLTLQHHAGPQSAYFVLSLQTSLQSQFYPLFFYKHLHNHDFILSFQTSSCTLQVCSPSSTRCNRLTK